jgi:predicted RNase H-like HicB family nuclease
MKKQDLHTVIWKEDKIFVAKFLELELASQGKTKKEAVSNLKEAFELYLESENVDRLSFPSVEEVTAQTVSM